MEVFVVTYKMSFNDENEYFNIVGVYSSMEQAQSGKERYIEDWDIDLPLSLEESFHLKPFELDDRKIHPKPGDALVGDE